MLTNLLLISNTVKGRTTTEAMPEGVYRDETIQSFVASETPVKHPYEKLGQEGIDNTNSHVSKVSNH